ncbi:hypothetical protein VSDKYIMU_CDS0188 [Enterococcus phage VRE9_4]
MIFNIRQNIFIYIMYVYMHSITDVILIDYREM